MWKPGLKRHQSNIERNYNVMELITVFTKQRKFHLRITKAFDESFQEKTQYSLYSMSED